MDKRNVRADLDIRNFVMAHKTAIYMKIIISDSLKKTLTQIGSVVSVKFRKGKLKQLEDFPTFFQYRLYLCEQFNKMKLNERIDYLLWIHSNNRGKKKMTSTELLIYHVGLLQPTYQLDSENSSGISIEDAWRYLEQTYLVMEEHNLIKRTLQQNNSKFIQLTGKGEKINEEGGWIKYCKKEERKESIWFNVLKLIPDFIEVIFKFKALAVVVIYALEQF